MPNRSACAGAVPCSASLNGNIAISLTSRSGYLALSVARKRAAGMSDLSSRFGELSGEVAALFGCSRCSELRSGPPLVRQMNLCYPLVRDDGARFMLKVCRNPDLRSAELGLAASALPHREAAIIDLLRRTTSLPVPRVVGAGVFAGERPVAYLAMEFLEGTGIRRLFWRLSALEREAIVRIVATCLRTVHCVPIAAGVRDQLGLTFPYDLRAYHLRKLRAAVRSVGKRHFDIAGTTARVERMFVQAIASVPQSLVLLHNDFGVRADNLLLARDCGRWRASGMLDFERCRLGLPVEDLVRFEMDLLRSALVAAHEARDERRMAAMLIEARRLGQLLLEAYGLDPASEVADVYHMLYAALPPVEALRV